MAELVVFSLVVFNSAIPLIAELNSMPIIFILYHNYTVPQCYCVYFIIHT